MSLPPKKEFDALTIDVCGLEIEMIERFYGTGRALRSQVPLTNHIVEGCRVLRHLGATVETTKAFIVHPLLQRDGDLASFVTERYYEYSGNLLSNRVVLLAMEYRNRANESLSDRVSLYDDGTARFGGWVPTPGPLYQVRQMLVADKIQNYKDFVEYNGDHPRSRELHFYFNRWMAALGVEREDVPELVQLCKTP